MNKKSLNTALALVLCGGLALTGCGSKNNTSGGNAAGKGNAVTNNSGTSADSGSKLKPYKIKLVYPGTAPKDLALVQDEMNKYLTEKINATIELKPIEWGSWEDKTNLMKISNESYDLMFTASWYFYPRDVSKGQYLDLDDLMSQYGKGIPDVLGPDFIKGARIGGKLYALPTNKEFGQGFGLLLSKKLVDKYKFNTNGIKSIEEVEAMLQTIKDKEPSVTPIISSKFTNIWDASNYDNIVGNLAIPRGSKELKVIDKLEDPKYIEFYKRMNTWNKNGWFDKDVLTSDTDQAMNTIKAGKGFAVASSLKPGKDKEMSVSSGVEVVQMETAVPFTTTGDAQGAMLGISRTSEDPARAMMFLNLLYTDAKLLNMLDWGVEGKHFVKKEDNVIDYPAGVTADTQGYPSPGGWMFGNQFNSYLWANEDKNKWELFKKFNESSERSIALGFTFDQEPVKSELASLANVDKEFTGALATGAVDAEKVIAKWKEKRNGAGFDKVKAEAQKQLDAWAKTQH
ncbi:ABC transporter substrate-binding protein [Paenibacillus baekrokdamisoli]|uniref:ABC transporter substrate-binding protein n=1 Tax=Paenibacillus baekrokdamisoli TaxID=1712516 RepID=A0A3G9J6Y2_9BACL|nr:ABC transporter substrate-binding protein [Paenibacillus baekrokdamisoli]MBB3069239.1 putative aldouronate transport system substrate-binding protein [Paenibacillus baekrokdamisoli]BBH18789.1 ABC transporter substrate-binding protein [Paenibacillus baekrokdamisoli]